MTSCPTTEGERNSFWNCATCGFDRHDLLLRREYLHTRKGSIPGSEFRRHPQPVDEALRIFLMRQVIFHVLDIG
jgi:hypothetical protein